MRSRESMVNERLTEMRDILIHLTKNTDLVVRYLNLYKTTLANRLQVTSDKFAIIIRAYENVKKQVSLVSALQKIDTQQSPEEVINHLYYLINEKEKDVICFFSALVHITKICDKHFSKLPDILKNNPSKFNEEAKEAFSNPDYYFAPVTLLSKLKALFAAIQKLDEKDQNVASLKRKVERLLKLSESYQSEQADPLDEGQFAYLEKLVAMSINDTPMRNGEAPMDGRGEKEERIKRRAPCVLDELVNVIASFADDMQVVHHILFVNQGVIRPKLNEKLKRRHEILTNKNRKKEELSDAEQEELNRLCLIIDWNRSSLEISRNDFSCILNVYHDLKVFLGVSDGVLDILKKLSMSREGIDLQTLHNAFQQRATIDFFFECLKLIKIYDYYLYLLADVVDELKSNLILIKNEKESTTIPLETFKQICFRPGQFLPQFKLLIVNLVEANLKDLYTHQPSTTKTPLTSITETPVIKVNQATIDSFFRVAFSIFRELDRLMQFATIYLNKLELPLDSDKQKENRAAMEERLQDTQTKKTYGGKAKLLRVKNSVEDDTITLCMYNEISQEFVFFSRELNTMKEKIRELDEYCEKNSPYSASSPVVALLGKQNKKGKGVLKPSRLFSEVAEVDGEKEACRDDEKEACSEELKKDELQKIDFLFSDYLNEIEDALKQKQPIEKIPNDLLEAFINIDNFIKAYNHLKDGAHTIEALATFGGIFKPAREEYLRIESALPVESSLYDEMQKNFHRLQRNFTIDSIKYAYERLFSGNFFYLPKRPSIEKFTAHLIDYANDKIILDRKIIELINKLPSATKVEIELALEGLKKLNRLNFAGFYEEFVQTKKGEIGELNAFYQFELKPAMIAYFHKIIEAHLEASIDGRPSQCGFTLFSSNHAYQAMLRQHRAIIDEYHPPEAEM